MLATHDPETDKLLLQAEHDAAEEKSIGFWTYLMSDAVIFSLLFATYAVMLGRTAGGPGAHQLFELPNTALETALLLVSSITFGFASLSAESGRSNRTLMWLGVTFALGIGFLVLELSEFSRMIAAGAGPDRSGFLSSFFTLVGTHGLHVSAGLVWIAVMAIQVRRKGLGDAVKSRLHRLGLFWHFLDIVWIGIFSFVYLPGVM